MYLWRGLLHLFYRTADVANGGERAEDRQAEKGRERKLNQLPSPVANLLNKQSDPASLCYNHNFFTAKTCFRCTLRLSHDALACLCN